MILNPLHVGSLLLPTLSSFWFVLLVTGAVTLAAIGQPHPTDILSCGYLTMMMIVVM